MPRLRTLTLRRGSTLYHGTNAREDFDVPDGPAWFSDAESVAREFATWHGDSGRPRVLTFKLTRNLRLARIDESADFDTATGTEDAANEYADPTELANEVCRRHDGWIIPTNYPDGADIMVCSPSGWVEQTGAQALSGVSLRRARRGPACRRVSDPRGRLGTWLRSSTSRPRKNSTRR